MIYPLHFFSQVVIRNKVKPVTKSINKSKKLSFISPGLSAPVNKTQTTPVRIVHYFTLTFLCHIMDKQEHNRLQITFFYKGSNF